MGHYQVECESFECALGRPRRQQAASPRKSGGLDDLGYSGIEARAKGGGRGRGKGGDYDHSGGGGNGRGNGGGKGGRGDGGGKGRGKGSLDGGGKGKDAQRGDGRYFSSANGTQICFSFTRNKDGCKKVCPFNRAHVCEFCRQPHRTIDCPKHPNWVAPSPGAQEK